MILQKQYAQNNCSYHHPQALFYHHMLHSQNFLIMSLTFVSSAIVSLSSLINFTLLSFVSFPFSISIFICQYNPLLFPPTQIFFITIPLCTCKALPTSCLASSFFLNYILHSFRSFIIYSTYHSHMRIIPISTSPLSNTSIHSVIYATTSVLTPFVYLFPNDDQSK